MNYNNLLLHGACFLHTWSLSCVNGPTHPVHSRFLLCLFPFPHVTQLHLLHSKREKNLKFKNDWVEMQSFLWYHDTENLTISRYNSWIWSNFLKKFNIENVIFYAFLNIILRVWFSQNIKLKDYKPVHSWPPLCWLSHIVSNGHLSSIPQPVGFLQSIPIVAQKSWYNGRNQARIAEELIFSPNSFFKLLSSMVFFLNRLTIGEKVNLKGTGLNFWMAQSLISVGLDPLVIISVENSFLPKWLNCSSTFEVHLSLIGYQST